MATINAQVLAPNPTDTLEGVNSLNQDVPPVPPGPNTADLTQTTYENTFAGQIKKASTQQATPSVPISSSRYNPAAPRPPPTSATSATLPQDRFLTELGDKGEAIVKQVISGDTLLIRAQKGVNGPPIESQITLTMIQAPRLGRRYGAGGDSSETTQDEPFAWASREFLRRLVIGQLVQYNTEITVKNSKRIAKVLYKNENLSEKIIQVGLAKLREQPSKKGSEEYERIIKLREEAEKLKLGVYGDATQDSIRNVGYLTPEDTNKFVDNNKGATLDGIVEQVINGNTLRLCIPSTHQHFSAQLTGIRCPGGTQGRDGDAMDDPELGARAKYAVEIRLLQRDVKIRVDGINNQSPLVTVLHVKGNIAEFLIQEGFARVMQWSQKHLPNQETRDKYKQLEDAAKIKGVKIWHGGAPLTAQTSYSGDRKKYQAKVLEIVSAEQLVVKTGEKHDSIQKVFLSSTRGPPRKESDSSRMTRALYDQPFFFEAREFLRKWLVGKRVSVEVDYTRPAQDQYSERTCVTILAPQGAGGVANDNVKNVAEALIIRGLAAPIKHKATDDFRSQHIDQLMRAEGIARDEGRGFHSKKGNENATLKVAELSTDVNKARTFLNSLQRSGKVKAVVEYVTSGNRFRIYIPKEQILISFILMGVSCPKGPGGPIPGEEPYGQEAASYAREKVLQHDVHIQVDSIDKRGSFIGNLYYENTRNLAQSLLEEGLAYIHSSAYGAILDLYDSTEKTAKKRHLRIWENYDETAGDGDDINLPSEDTREFHEASGFHDPQPSDPLKNAREMIVTEVHRPNCLWAQPVTTAETVRDFSAKMKEHFRSNSSAIGQIFPKRNMKVAAMFMDNEWYRAEVQQIQSQDSFLVHYLDYGNSLVLTQDKMARLPDQLASLPAQAKEFQLALTTPSDDEEWNKEAQRELLFSTLNKHVYIQTMPKHPSQTAQTSDPAIIYTSQDGESDVGKQLISDGLLLVDSKRRDKKMKQLFEEYQQVELSAKAKHLNIWEYGDIREDNVPEFGYTPKKIVDKKAEPVAVKGAATSQSGKEAVAKKK